MSDFRMFMRNTNKKGFYFMEKFYIPEVSVLFNFHFAGFQEVLCGS